MTTSELILLAVKAGATVIQLWSAFLFLGVLGLLIEKETMLAGERTRVQRRAAAYIFAVLILSMIGTWWGVRL